MKKLLLQTILVSFLCSWAAASDFKSDIQTFKDQIKKVDETLEIIKTQGCTPYGCPIPRENPGYRAPDNSDQDNLYVRRGIRSRWGGRYRPPRENTIDPETHTIIQNSSVRVLAALRGGMNARGSGTLVKWKTKKDTDHVVVLTAGHVVRGSHGDFYIEHNRYGRAACRLLQVDYDKDWAILEPLEKQEELYRLATDIPRTHSSGPYFIAGFDGTTSLRILRSDELDMLQNGYWVDLAAPSRPGDSGGGVFNENGKIVAIIWGSDFVSSTLATRLEAPVDWLDANEETCFRWRHQPRPQPKEEPKPEPKPEPKAKPKEEPKPEPKPEPKQEPEQKPEVKPEPTLWDYARPTVYVLVGWLSFVVTYIPLRFLKFRGAYS